MATVDFVRGVVLIVFVIVIGSSVLPNIFSALRDRKNRKLFNQLISALKLRGLVPLEVEDNRRVIFHYGPNSCLTLNRSENTVKWILDQFVYYEFMKDELAKAVFQWITDKKSVSATGSIDLRETNLEKWSGEIMSLIMYSEWLIVKTFRRRKEIESGFSNDIKGIRHRIRELQEQIKSLEKRKEEIIKKATEEFRGEINIFTLS